MKFSLFILSILVSFNLSAQGKLLLSAACKVSCIVDEQEISVDQGYPTTQKFYETIYLDLFKLSREEIDNQSRTRANSLCKKHFGENAYVLSKSIDCILFKN